MQGVPNSALEAMVSKVYYLIISADHHSIAKTTHNSVGIDASHSEAVNLGPLEKILCSLAVYGPLVGKAART